jgi:hypothetical protein
MRSPLAPAVFVAAALLVRACTESATISAGTPVPGGVPAPAGLPGEGTDHAPGHHGTEIEAFPGFGFVHAVDASEFPNMAVVDDAEHLTGAEARAALEEDFGPDGGDLPNGFYLRNTNPGLAEYPMAGNVVITVTDRDGTERVLTPSSGRSGSTPRSVAATWPSSRPTTWCSTRARSSRSGPSTCPDHAAGGRSQRATAPGCNTGPTAGPTTGRTHDRHPHDRCGGHRALCLRPDGMQR